MIIPSIHDKNLNMDNSLFVVTFDNQYDKHWQERQF